MADNLALLRLHPKAVPLDAIDQRDVIRWLRQVADELERGEHWGSALFALSMSRPIT